MFTVVGTSPGAEDKLRELMEQVGPELFQEGRREEGELQAAEEQEDDELSDDLEAVEEDKEDKEDKEEPAVPVVTMPQFDSYGLPKDGFNYYQFIKSEVSGGDFIAAEPQEGVNLMRDTDFSHHLTPQEQAVMAALDNAEDYDSMSSDFVQEAAATPPEDPEFEQVAEEYNTEQREEDYPRDVIKGRELELLMEEFKREHPDMMEEEGKEEHVEDMPKPLDYDQDHLLHKWEAKDSDEDGDAIAERVYNQISYREPPETDDVESVVSTYTNTDNRPAVLTVKSTHKTPKTAPAKPEEPESKPAPQVISIPENETKEEKKARKAAFKEAKKDKRAQKKALKESFKSEKVRQTQQASGTYDTPQGYSVVKIS